MKNLFLIFIGIMLILFSGIYFYYNHVEDKIYVLTIKCIGSGKVYPPPGRYVYRSMEKILLNASPSNGYIFSHWIINSSKYYVNPLEISLNGNTSIVVVFNKSIFHIYFYSNIDGIKIYLNESKIDIPYILNYSGMVRLNLHFPSIIEGDRILLYEKTLVDERLYKNNSVVLRCKEADIHINIYYSIKNLNDSVIILSNHGEYCYINGSRRSIPYILRSSGEIFGEKVFYINETHAYWLAWYTVKYRDNSIRNYIYLFRKRLIANISDVKSIYIHYVLGLRYFPYVRKIWFWPPFRYNYTLSLLNKTFMGKPIGKRAWCAHYRIENKILVFYNFNKYNVLWEDNYRVYADFLFEFDENVSGAYIEFWSTNTYLTDNPRRAATSDVIPFKMLGQTSSLKAYLFSPIPGRRYIIYVGLDDVKDLPNYFPGDNKISYFDYQYFIDTGDPDKPLPWPYAEGRFGIHFTLGYIGIPRNAFNTFKIYVRVIGVKP